MDIQEYNRSAVDLWFSLGLVYPLNILRRDSATPTRIFDGKPAKVSF